MVMKTKFRQMRLNAKLTQGELAKELGVNQSLISNLERGTRRIDDYVITLYSNYFHTDPNFLFDFDKQPLKISEATLADYTDEQLLELLNVITKRITSKRK